MTTQNYDPVFNRKEAAAYINYSYNTLAVWDSTKRYDLQPIKIGRSVRYRKSSLDAFLSKHRFSAI
ncbi:MAG: helix-turn-helix domain-containing protein [Bacteroidetes bacterium]|nr:helix-turn-helix domain-containing protein [Bacteroidota bacterium]